MYDIVIIGAGPAGSTFARLAEENYKILLVDKRELNGSHENFSSRKCCGGLLAPDAQRMLSKLQLGLPKLCLYKRAHACGSSAYDAGRLRKALL